MTNSLERMFDGIIDALRSRVIPKIDDEFARGQAYGALDLLCNLKPRVEWAVGPLYDDVAERLALLERLAVLCERVTPPPPAPPSATLAKPRLTAAELEPMRDRLDEYLCEVLRWTAMHRAILPAGRANEIEAAIRDQQRAQLRREVKLTPPPLFGEISRGQ